MAVEGAVMAGKLLELERSPHVFRHERDFSKPLANPCTMGTCSHKDA